MGRALMVGGAPVRTRERVQCFSVRSGTGVVDGACRIVTYGASAESDVKPRSQKLVVRA